MQAIDPVVAAEEQKLICAWTQAFSEHSHHEALLENLRTATSTTCLYPEEIRDVFHRWCDGLYEREEGVVSFKRNSEAVLCMAQGMQYPNLQPCRHHAPHPR
ncbi:unnamed protein product [Durusdinium trenchii]|uniref:Uncharacterized protein n=1 Tax=Durusdinium trenchii TaxID=1381693 RepID=A0ABP0K6S6_9DINO